MSSDFVKPTNEGGFNFYENNQEIIERLKKRQGQIEAVRDGLGLMVQVDVRYEDEFVGSRFYFLPTTDLDRPHPVHGLIASVVGIDTMPLSDEEIGVFLGDPEAALAYYETDQG